MKLGRLRFWSLAGALCGLVLAARAISAAESSPSIALAPLPLYGADVRSLVFDPSDPNRAYAGTSAGHVYRTDDGGLTFRNAGGELPFPNWVVGALAFDENRPNRLWAGLWGIWGGGRVAYSDDGGRSWALRPGSATGEAQVYAIATVPGVPDRLFVGTRAGVELSDDAGEHFRPVGRELPGLIHVSSLYVDRADPRIVVAGTWRQAYRSEDGGTTWRGIFDGMILDTEVFSLHPSFERPGELWASTCGWVYRGDELGTRWTRFQSGLVERRTPSFAVLPGERLLAGTVAGAFLSTDRGASFRRTTPESLAVLAIAFHPAHPERILLGTEGAGIWASNDAGESFRARPVAMRNLRVPALDGDESHLVAAVAHAGPASGVYRSPDGGNSFEPLPSSLPTVLHMAQAGGRLFVATERGLFERQSMTSGAAAASEPLRFERLAALGERRVEQLASADGRLAVRTREAIFELDPAVAKGAPHAIPLPAAPPKARASLRSVAYAASDLWVLRDDGLFRRVNGKFQAASLPYPPGSGSELLSMATDLIYSGREGLFRRASASGAWQQLRAGPVRTLATGDATYPLLIEAGGKLTLLAQPAANEAASMHEEAWWPLELPYPAEETLTARVAGGRLLLGSSGFGLWEARLPLAPVVAGAQRPVASDSSIRK